MSTFNNAETGKLGEHIAEEELRQNGFLILSKNFRLGRYEIDIIAFKEKTLHFIEVKTRRQKKFGFPEQSVGENKIEKMKMVADAFLHSDHIANIQYQMIQFDILAIEIMQNGKTISTWIRDVYD